MIVTLSGIVIVFIEGHSANEYESIDCTLLPMVMLSREVQPLNASTLIAVTLSVTIIFLREVQLWKISSPKTVIPLPRVTDSSA